MYHENSLCIFFGPTPVSTGSQPKMDSPGVPFGKIISGDISSFKGMDSSVKMILKLNEAPS
ncbi:cyclophilin-like family protein [Clostridium pasteurianum]|uniref:cyclophilin-like family protein n=1 Tax=Clostridium pasteurianum TaxID=1501 RepID=UPI00039DD446|nr:cyclophilin-like family protein [Clostridium pasteurianum]